IKSIDFGKVAADPRSNSILCTATPQELALFRVAVESLDRPAKEGGRKSAAGGNGGGRGQGAESAEGSYVLGAVPRPGTYQLPAEGITVRRLLAAAGGLGDGVREVVISDSKDGSAVVMQHIDAADLRRDDGPDPVVGRGQLVSVR